MRGCDYVGRIAATQLLAAGCGFACRYLSVPGYSKNLTATEVADFKAHGVAIVTVFETTASRALDGYAAGRSDAESAESQLAALGGSGQPVYFAVDFDMTATQRAAVVDYFAGAASILGRTRTGVYGGIAAVGAVLNAGDAVYAWQTTAWSSGQWDSRANIRQLGTGVIAGTDVDYDESMTSDFGQWQEDQMIINGSVPTGYGYSAPTATNPAGALQDLASVTTIVLETQNGGAVQAPEAFLSLGCDGPAGLTVAVRVAFILEGEAAWSHQQVVNLTATSGRVLVGGTSLPPKTGVISLSRMGTPAAAGAADPGAVMPISYCVLYMRA